MNQKEKNDFAQKAKELVKAMWHTYVLARNEESFQHMLQYMTKDFVLIGTGKTELYSDLPTFIKALQADQEEAGTTVLEIADEWYEVQLLSEDFCLVYGGLYIKEKPQGQKPILADMDTRFSFICQKKDGAIVLRNLHHSVPNIDQLPGEYYPRSITQTANEAIQKNLVLEKQLQLDSLTALFHRTYTENYINQVLRQKRDGYAFFMLDLDDFKQINDTYGHLQGDHCLKQFASFLQMLAGEQCLVSRLGGDEFSLFSTAISTPQEAEQFAQTLMQSLHEQNFSFPIQCSIGISLAPDGGNTFQELYTSADKALYQSKREGKNSWRIYHK